VLISSDRSVQFLSSVVQDRRSSCIVPDSCGLQLGLFRQQINAISDPGLTQRAQDEST